MKKVLVLSVIIVILVITLASVKDHLIKRAITSYMTRVTGAAVTIDVFSLSLIKQSVRIQGFKLYNPEGFPQGVLLDIPEVRADYDFALLLGKRVHLYLLLIDLKEARIFRNRDGRLNVDSLKVAQKEKRPSDSENEKMPMQIDTLVLSVGKVSYKDFTRPELLGLQEFNINIKDRTYKNITSARQLAVLVLIESIKGTAIKDALIYGVGNLLDVGRFPVGVAQDVLNKITEGLKDAAK